MRELIALIAFCIFPVFLFAHSPREVTLKYEKDNEREILKIHIDHSVRNVERHYVESVTININDEEFRVLEFTSQNSSDSHDIKVDLPGLKEGDIVEVRADCSRIGSRSGELKIK